MNHKLFFTISGLILGGIVIHDLLAAHLVEAGVSGTLLAGGGDTGGIAMILGFLALRLFSLVAVPTWIMFGIRCLSVIARERRGEHQSKAA